MLQMRLKPVKIGESYEPIEISFKHEDDQPFYPEGYAHIDAFWEGSGADNELYELLREGNVAVIDLAKAPYVSVDTKCK